MRRIAWLAGCAGFCLSPLVAAPVVIQPLGDSITWGYTTASAADSPGGYREPLYRNLTLAGMDVHFVGSNTPGTGPKPANNPGPLLLQDNETLHDGYPKYTIADIRDNLDGNRQPTGNNQPGNRGGFWLTGVGGRSAVFPDDILLLIGTNDIEGGERDAAVIEQRLDALVLKIYQLRPETHLFLSSIPPYPADALKTGVAQAYNSLIEAKTVPKFAGLGFEITFVDQYANFVTPSPTGDVVISGLYGDNVHPNEAGYQRMGDTWAAAIVPEPPASMLILPALAGCLALRVRRR